MGAFTPAEVFPPGYIIQDELEARGWTQEDLAAIMRRPLQAINEIIKAKKRVTEETGVLGVDFRSVVGERLDAARAALDETAASAARTAGLTQNPADVLSAAQARNSRMPPNQVD